MRRGNEAQLVGEHTLTILINKHGCLSKCAAAECWSHTEVPFLLIGSYLQNEAVRLESSIFMWDGEVYDNTSDLNTLSNIN